MMIWPGIDENGSRMKTGIVDGTGTDLFVSVPEFTPRCVLAFNLEGLLDLVWSEPMGPGTAIVRDGTGAATALVSNGITPVLDLDLFEGGRGFLIGSAAGVNASGQSIHWVAWE